MAVTTMLWETRTSPIGDALADGYTDTQTRDFFQALIAGGMDGVFRGYGNELLASPFGSTQVKVQSGAAFADGVFGINDSDVYVTLPNGGTGTGFIITFTIYDTNIAIDTIHNNTVGIGYTMNTLNTLAPPAPVQIRGQRWDVVLAQGIRIDSDTILPYSARDYFSGSPEYWTASAELDDMRRFIGHSPYMVLADTIVLNSVGVSSVSFEVPQTFDELVLHFRIRVPSSKTIRARFNDDNFTTYSNLRLSYSADAVAHQYELAGQVEMFGAFPAVSTTRPLYTQIMHLPNYSSGDVRKIGYLEYAPTYTGELFSNSAFSWRRPDSIRKITLSTTDLSTATFYGTIAIFGITHGAQSSPLNSPIGYWS